MTLRTAIRILSIRERTQDTGGHAGRDFSVLRIIVSPPRRKTVSSWSSGRSQIQGRWADEAKTWANTLASSSLCGYQEPSEETLSFPNVLTSEACLGKHKEPRLVLCDYLERWEGGGWKGGSRGRSICRVMTDSSCCTAKPNTTV